MSGFWGKIFGTDKALSGIVDGVRDGLDALVYTEEERENAAASDRSEARKMVVGWMTATQGQNLARRLIALAVTGVWLMMYLVSTLLSMSSVFVDELGNVTSEKMVIVSDIAKGAAQDMNPAVMLILAFYFAAPHMGDIAKAVTGRFVKDTERTKG